MIREPSSPYELQINERPRERLLRLGSRALSERELLAIVIEHGPPLLGSLGLADQLIQRFGGLAELARAPASELQNVFGIGQVKAVKIIASLELGRRVALSTVAKKDKIKTPTDAAQHFMVTMGHLEQEELHVMILDARNQVLGGTMVYRGTINAVAASVGLLYREAIRLGGHAVILAHNHPSGDPSPSAEDVRMTKQMVQAGKLLEIECLDHLIVAQSRYCSLRERGLGFD